ncbi:MAG: hypothetical protein QM781_15030 [Chitinophagaceae bacterium]
MKIDIFRLTSIDHAGVGNEENGLVDLLYSFLLWKNGLDYYKYILINQIGKDQQIKEVVQIKNGRVHVNLIYTTEKNFDQLDDYRKNTIKVDIIHEGLQRLSKVDPRFSDELLNKIRGQIISKNFSVELESIGKNSPFDKEVSGKMVILPTPKYFDYYLLIKNGSKEICRQFIYRGAPTSDYFYAFFSRAKWKNNITFIVEGREKQMRLKLDVSNCKVTFENLTHYPNPPLWEIMKVGISEQESKSAYENWLHSLPPAVAAMIRDHEN